MKQTFLILLLLPFFVLAQHSGTTKLEVKQLPTPPSVDATINEFLSHFNETASLSPTQKEWFYWTNYSRSNPRRFWDSVVAPILNIYPGFRNSYTQTLQKDLYNTAQLPLVKPNNDLYNTAQTLAKDLAAKKSKPSHTSPSGVTFEQRMQSISVKKCAGENISFGPPNTILMLVLLYIDEGVPDFGHRKSLLNPLFEEMGIGVGAYPDSKFMVVQDFACSQK